MLKTRIISALILGPLILGMVYLGGIFYTLLLLTIVNLAIYEYDTLLNHRGYNTPHFLNHLAVNLFLIVFYLELYTLLFPIMLLILFAYFIYILLNAENRSCFDSAVSIFGVLYLSPLVGFLLLLRIQPEGMIYLYCLLGGVWLHDSLAYFIGIKWGTHKFAPFISPNKSVEGSLAGIAGTVIAFFLLATFYPQLLSINPVEAIIFGLGLAVFAQFGDLLESAFKRQVEVKDTSGFIPGHGGILDRFDSLIVTAPFVYYFFQIINIM
ncbi:MAG: phosphatidate cytidylyltransferase [Bacillota bacterium]|nr:phosphatidate cytidylyltransferase [Bacillota bacterium]